MKEIYDWVPWFKELAGKIAEGDERYLTDRAKKVMQKDDDDEKPPLLLRHGKRNIDPLSFFYTLASRSRTSASRNRIYRRIADAFDMTQELDLDCDDAFIFPTPQAAAAVLHKEGKGNPSLLWTLFRSAVSGFETYEMRAGIFKRIVEAAKKRPGETFVLIIDEINRGNIAKVFGELITLIEDSRRIGRDDETRVTLPYSGDAFGIPDNLSIIGTMNTADRSIQLLDTALRRRFHFIEMMPNPDHEHICEDIDGINCKKMLKTMNERIAALLDREHQVGHTYLLDVDNTGQLSETFRNRIFPLLQEYFFDDWAKIRAILGHNAFVTKREIGDLFLESDSADEGRVIYERLPDDDPGWKEPDQYRKIYGGEATGEPEDT